MAVQVSDIHGKLYPTEVAEVVFPETVADVQAAVRRAKATGVPIAIAGGRHAMGGQQFAHRALLLDMSQLDRVIEVDLVAGEVLVLVL